MKQETPVSSRKEDEHTAHALPPATFGDEHQGSTRPRRKRSLSAQIRAALPFTGQPSEEERGSHDAELFYFQKQIQMQTPMVFVLEDGKQIYGVIEWYDRNSIKVRGRQRQLIYKSAIKYIYKHGENSATGGQ